MDDHRPRFLPKKVRQVCPLDDAERVEVKDLELEEYSRTSVEDKGSPMEWLFWKEYRQNRLIVFTALVLLLTPHLIALCAALRTGFSLARADQRLWSRGLHRASSMYQPRHLAIGDRPDRRQRDSGRACRSVVAIPVLAARFTRKKILGSKLLLCAGDRRRDLDRSIVVRSACGWRVSRADLGMNAHPSLRGPDDAWLASRSVAMMFFCVSWLLSSFLSSPTFAVGGGLISSAAACTPEFASAAISSTSTTTGTWTDAALMRTSCSRTLASASLLARAVFWRGHVVLSAARGAVTACRQSRRDDRQ